MNDALRRASLNFLKAKSDSIYDLYFGSTIKCQEQISHICYGFSTSSSYEGRNAFPICIPFVGDLIVLGWKGMGRVHADVFLFNMFRNIWVRFTISNRLLFLVHVCFNAAVSHSKTSHYISLLCI